MVLAIVIVNYKTYKLTKQTIEAVVAKSHEFKYEILLVDNASLDGSIEQLEEDYKYLINEGVLRIYKNNENVGFAKANNKGIKEAKGKYILLLNSDTVILGDCLEKSIKRIEKDASIGALGAKVILADGRLDHACKRGFPTPAASFYYLTGMDKRNPQKYGQYDALWLDENTEGEVDALMGAYMLMPRKVLEEVGVLDERFFMYGEDIDLCYRIKAAGYKILYYPYAKLVHYKGGSSKKRRTKVIYDFHHAMWLFYKKHYVKKYNLLVSGMVYIGIWLKYLLEIIKNTLKS